jgi:hypothetical protein
MLKNLIMKINRGNVSHLSLRQLLDFYEETEPRNQDIRTTYSKHA